MTFKFYERPGMGWGENLRLGSYCTIKDNCFERRADGLLVYCTNCCCFTVYGGGL
jgi:hypothetical protein